MSSSGEKFMGRKILLISHKRKDEKWTGDEAYPFIEWKIFFGIQMFWIDHFMISANGNTWQWDLHFEGIC